MFGGGPVLTHATPRKVRTANAAEFRDDADQALFSLFQSSSIRVAACIVSDRQPDANTNRDRIERTDTQSEIWIKLLGTIRTALANESHHASVTDAALQLLNNMIQPICKSSEILLNTAVIDYNLVPPLVGIIQREGATHSLLERGCNAVRRIAASSKHRRAMSHSVPALLDIVVRRSSPLVVDAALSCLQNLSISKQFSANILGARGVPIILNVLTDQSCVEAGCNTLANIAAHPELRRPVADNTGALKVLLDLIQSSKLNSWMSLRACFALNNLCMGQTATSKECSAMGGAAIVDSLRAHLESPKKAAGAGDRLLRSLDPKSTKTSTKADDSKKLRRKKPREPKWFAPFLLRLKQSGRAMRRCLILSNVLSEDARLGSGPMAVFSTSSGDFSNGYDEVDDDGMIKIDAAATARSYRCSMEETGFACTEKINGTRKQMRESLRSFEKTVRLGDVVVVIFVGHGVSVHGQNYLLPTDFPILGRKTDVERHGMSMQKISCRLTEAVGGKGVLLWIAETSPTVNGGGERFEPMCTVDCTELSKHDNVCCMMSTTRPTSAAHCSTFSEEANRLLSGDGDGGGGRGGTRGGAQQGESSASDSLRVTAFTYEMCRLLVKRNVEASTIPHRLRRTLSDCNPDITCGGGRLPWCNSSMIEEFYFNELVTNGKGEVDRRKMRNGGERSGDGRSGGRGGDDGRSGGGNSGGDSSSPRRARGRTGSNIMSSLNSSLNSSSVSATPTASTLAKRRSKMSSSLSSHSWRHQQQQPQQQPQPPPQPPPSTFHGSPNGLPPGRTTTSPRMVSFKNQNPTFNGMAEETMYSLNRQSEFLDTTALTSRRTNLTDVIAASVGMSGADVAGAAR